MTAERSPLPFARPITIARRGGGNAITLEALDDDLAIRAANLINYDATKDHWLRRGDGTLGSLARAFILARALWAVRALTAQEFGQKLQSYIAGAALQAGVEPPPALDTARLTAWVQKSRRITMPAASLMPIVDEALTALAAEYTPVADLILARAWTEPADLLRTLVAALVQAPDEGDQQRPRNSYAIEQSLFADKPFEDSASLKMLAEISDAFRGDQGKRNILVVHGPAFSGKRRYLSSIVAGADMINQGSIATTDGPIRLFARANCEVFESLVHDIAEFLDIPTHDQTPLITQVDTLLEQIEKHPPSDPRAFLLGNVSSDANPLSDLLHNQALPRLLGALSAPGKTNRILLTSKESLADNPFLLQYNFIEFAPDNATSAELAAKVSVKLPDHLDILYLDNTTFELLEVKLKLEQERKLDVLITEEYLAGILSEVRKKAGFDTPKKGSIGHDWTGREDLRFLAGDIYDNLDITWERDLLILLALSIDGLRFPTIKIIVTDLQKHMPPHEQITDEALRAIANKLVARLSGLCIHIVADGPYPQEYRPGTSVQDSAYFLLPPYREIFEAMLYERCAASQDASARPHPSSELAKKLQKLNWHIATAAFRLQYWLRVNVPPQKITGFKRMRLQGQAIQRALLGIDPSELISGMREEDESLIPRSAMEARVFAGCASARVALRYVYYDLFVNDLDADNRLSLQFRRDDLRLELLSAFCCVGRPVYMRNTIHGRASEQAAPQQVNYFKSWEPLRAGLGPFACMKILGAIAVSAREVGAWDELHQLFKKPLNCGTMNKKSLLENRSARRIADQIPC